MNLQPGIETIKEIKLIGTRRTMSFADNQTALLWQTLMPRRAEITKALGTNLYSVEIYNDPRYFQNFDPTREFEKWAAMPVSDFNAVPAGMYTLTIPAGEYAVFPYRGKSSEAKATYQYIYGGWIPNSPYELDDRPHFAVMGEKYKGEDPESEEEIWIPVAGRQ